MENSMFNRLFVFELANNHSGDFEHGARIIKELGSVIKQFDFRFALKFQYRDLKTFIHPDYQDRKDIKYIKRFSETALTQEQFLRLKDVAVSEGFLTMCTPFDEVSVKRVVEHDFDILKIASCSLTDWPLLEKIVQTDLPIIASTASASVEELDNVVTFFENRKKNFAIMHCVGEYPTDNAHLQLNQIDFLRARYCGCRVGFSTHEHPDNIDSIKMAIAKGAEIFERHVAIESDLYPRNAYSSTPEQLKNWLDAAKTAYEILGVEGERYLASEKEKSDINGLRRGVFASKLIKKGETISKENVFFAIPCSEDQLKANDISKYVEYTLETAIDSGRSISLSDVSAQNLKEKILQAVKKIKNIIVKANVALPEKVDLEISHHYGLDNYEEWGAAILNCINREYCKKLIVLVEKQKHPFHYHVKKEETFYVLYGSMCVTVGEEKKLLKAGDMLTVERGVNHDFSTDEGVIFEEISTTHYKNDSFYEDERISENSARKTNLTFRAGWLRNELR